MPADTLRPAPAAVRPAAGPPPQRVLMIAYHFPPSPEMGAQACGQIARYLPEYGWEPVVLTVDERYFPDRDPTTSGLFPGIVCRTGTLPHPLGLYRWARSFRRPTGARAGGAPPGSSAGAASSLRRWMLSMLLVPDELTGWLPVALARGLRLIRREHVAQLWSSGPFWTNHLVALGLKRLTGLPWVAHFRDPWAQFKLRDLSVPESGASAAVERRLERWVVRGADAVVCVTERHTEGLRAFYRDVEQGKFLTIPNGYAPEEFDGLAADGEDPARDRPGQFAITYTGTLYIWRDLTPLLMALRRLIDDGQIPLDDIVLNLVGRCELAQGRPVRDIAREVGLEGVLRLPGMVSRRRSHCYMVASDLLVLLAENLALQIPGKTYEYLRAGRPVLALASDGATADLIRKTRAGEVIAPGDVPAIARFVGRLYHQHRAGQRPPGADPAVIGDFDRRVLTGRFAGLFSELVNGRAR